MNCKGEADMRGSDDRYTRDRQKFDLAVRLIRHEARTYTIRQWTGLSDDRIRKLYRSYVWSSGTQSGARHRGRTPRRALYLFRISELHCQGAQTASLFLLFGLLNEGMNAARLGFRL